MAAGIVPCFSLVFADPYCRAVFCIGAYADGQVGALTGVVDTRTTKEGVEFVLAQDTSPQTILDQLRAQDLTINSFEISTPSLHSIFLDMVGENHE